MEFANIIFTHCIWNNYRYRYNRIIKINFTSVLINFNKMSNNNFMLIFDCKCQINASSYIHTQLNAH